VERQNNLASLVYLGFKPESDSKARLLITKLSLRQVVGWERVLALGHISPLASNLYMTHQFSLPAPTPGSHQPLSAHLGGVRGQDTFHSKGAARDGVAIIGNIHLV
jgi:hypothetical protein